MEKTKKKLSIGKVWILVCVIAAVLGLAFAHVTIVQPEMAEYNDHECTSGCNEHMYCVRSHYDDAFSCAMGRVGLVPYIVFAGGALAIANVVMLILWSVRRSNAKAAAEPQAAPVSIPMGEGERTVLSRCYAALFPIVLMVLGVLSALIGLIFLMDYDEAGIPLLIIGIVFAVAGILLRKVMKIHLMVTTKRVYLKAPFASRANLPLNRIAAVSTGLFHYLKITSAAGMSGQIRLVFVPKYLEVYDTVNALLNEVE